MHGHMGNEQITLKNISVEIVNKNLNVLGLKGPVPGARKSLVMIKF
jgi:large subunit ribosomal protein L3